MPKLIGSTHSSNDNYNGDCDWAVLDMTEDKAKKILAWMDKAKEFKAENSQFYSLEFWWGFSCYSAAALDDCNRSGPFTRSIIRNSGRKTSHER